GRALVFRQTLQHTEHQLLSLLCLILFFGRLRARAQGFNDAIKKPVARLAAPKLIERQIARDAIEPEARFTDGDRAPDGAMQLQKTLLRQILRDACPPAQQAFEKPAEARI